MKIRHRIEEKNGELKEAHGLRKQVERFICYASANVFYGIYSKCKTNSKIRRAGYGVNHSFL